MKLDLFLKRFGKLCFSQIRPIFFFILLLFPILFSAMLVFLENQSFQELEMRFQKAARKEKLAFAKKDRKEVFLHRYSQADPYFLDREIETLPLLQAEQEKLTSLANHPAFLDTAALKNRFDFLQENHISFIEQEMRNTPHIKEVEETLKHPIQLDESDLQKLLSIIDNLPIGSFHPIENSPQLMITEFKMKKLKTPLQTEVFEVDMSLLKREFSQ